MDYGAWCTCEMKKFDWPEFVCVLCSARSACQARGDYEPTRSVPGRNIWFIFERFLARVQSRLYCPTMANSGDDQELQNETTVRLIALSLCEKAFDVVFAIVFGTTAVNTYSIRPWPFGQS